MTVWNKVVKTALLGTNRANLPTFASDIPLGKLLNQIPQEEDASALLSIAGAMALHSQTGWQPPHAPLPPTAATQPAELPLCPSHISGQLNSLLEGSQTALLPELFEALAQSKHRVADTVLPNLLQKGAKSVILRPYILKIIGRRGRWLAEQNRNWHYASPRIESWAGLLDEWQTAVPIKRQALLRQLRTSQPERGRQILEQTWKSNNGLVRHQLIKILAINLSMTDEPFLEIALDDRNHLVRRTASDLLARLPNSRLCQRMVKYTTNILVWTPNQKQAITVHLPDSLTPAIIRDGIPSSRKEDLPKLRARLLSQIVSRVPLQFWTKQWEKTALEIAQAAKDSKWPRTLTSAFATAAIRQQNEEWAVALLTANQFDVATGRLIPVLTNKTCYTLMQQAAQQSIMLQRPHPLYTFLQQWRKPWTTEMGLFWIEHFASHLEQTDTTAPDPALHNLLKRFGQKCAPSLAETAVSKLTNIPNLSNAWQKTIQNLCQTLQLRRNLLAEIAQLNQPPGGFIPNDNH
jgi:hypothetical protein